MANQDFAFINFLEFQDSVLNAGKYKISISQKLKQGGTDRVSESIERFLHIKGNRFSLDPSDTYSVYPAAGSESSCETHLPFIMLNRSSLPWERSIDNDEEAPSSPNPPWLALLVFHEVEGSDEVVPIQKNMTLQELHQSVVNAAGVFVPGIGDSFALEFGEKPDDPVTVIDVDPSLLKDIVPKRADLAYTGHVRRDATTKLEADVDHDSEKAVIVANRLPRPGARNVAHLVSIRGAYVGESGEFDLGDNSKPIRLVSLKNWSFQCVARTAGQTAGTFKDLLKALDSRTFQRKALDGSSTMVTNYFEKGFTVLPHHLRVGESTVSLYRSPLCPGTPPSPPERTTSPDPEPLVPVESADKLLFYDRQSGMLDVSYAAAWTLGRQMALADRRFSLQLYEHKQLESIHALQQRERVDPTLQKLPLGEVKAEELAKLLVAKQEREKGITDWLHDQRYLGGLPFQYLVPSSPKATEVADEALTNFLPPESIRFFQLDNTWFKCLQDGALSVGDTAKAEDISRVVPYQDTGMISGFLLRSRVVAGFPAMEVEGFEADLATPDDTNLVSGGILPTISKMLSDEVLLCLFEGNEIKTVDIFLPPTSLHFGFKETDGLFVKDVKDVTGIKVTDEAASANGEHWQDKTGRVMDLSALADSLQDTLNTVKDILTAEGREEFLGIGETLDRSQFTAADFAMQMLEGAPRVRISVR